MLTNKEEIFNELKRSIYSELDITRELEENYIYDLIDRKIENYSQNKIIPLTLKESLKQRLFNSIRKLDILQELLDDDSITEIMINGYRNIFIEKKGQIIRYKGQFESDEKLADIAQKIAAMSNRIVNESSPIVDTRLEDGSRVNIVLPPVALNGPVITIRKFYESPLSLEKLIEINSITKEAAIFLENAVKSRLNIFVSGGTGSGKTTFLNALSNFIPEDERVITIEDSAELQLTRVKNLVRLEARNANIEGKNAISIRDLIKSSLRMRPDRIVVGECRGGEALDMLTSMNTGHDGSLSTGHSNSSEDMLSRLETMVLMSGIEMPLDAIRQQIASAIDLIVHLKRMRDKTRKVVEITEVLNYEDGTIKLNPIFLFKEEGEDEEGKILGSLQRTNNKLMAKKSRQVRN
ncbi:MULTISPECIES: CpaF family protein [Lachnospira]|jgi:pilus assembly protein CpaF|uniref:Pilus assembly protein CpaF n=1 Tax=Lachnospira pectinoschiza TaxID=28052 RepID=A0A1G9YW89_9FIRM|nr:MULTISPECIES: CpaF family protein [Lachnospira]SDN13167.1 pilus assembly protein CpaF [Lachnospira pectinoschiza]